MEYSQPGTKASSGGLVHHDPKTGEHYLRVPVPEKETMARLADVLGDLLAGR